MVVSDSCLSLVIPLVRYGMTDEDKEERHVLRVPCMLLYASGVPDDVAALLDWGPPALPAAQPKSMSSMGAFTMHE